MAGIGTLFAPSYSSPITRHIQLCFNTIRFKNVGDSSPIGPPLERLVNLFPL